MDLTSFVDALASARVYDLEQQRYAGAPVTESHEPGFNLLLHRRHEPGTGEARTGASAMLMMTEHSGTHIDALSHQAVDMKLHGGVVIDPSVQTFTGFTQLGTETIAPILARGLLLDAARHAGVERFELGEAIDDLEAVAKAQGVEVRRGDVVLVRTGNGAVFGDRETYLAGAGLAVGASRWLAERQPLAVGADNLAWDALGDPDPELGSIPGHVVLIVRAGIYIIESLFLEELARDEQYEFAFVCLPLKLRGGTGSPVRPVAVVPRR